MEHVWSGWPGAHCLKCGASDPLELALADNWYDPFINKFDTLEHEEAVKKANECSGPQGCQNCGGQGFTVTHDTYCDGWGGDECSCSGMQVQCPCEGEFKNP